MDLCGSMRPINCGIRQFKRQHMFFESCTGYWVNPVNNIYSLACKVQQTFFVPAKKKKKRELGEQHNICLLLKSHYSY